MKSIEESEHLGKTQQMCTRERRHRNGGAQLRELIKNYLISLVMS